MRSLLARRTIGLRRDRRTIAATTAVVLLLPTGLVSLITAPSASASEMTDPVIEAIMGGGAVIGTECVNGKVIESLYESGAEFKDLGETATLYVKDTSSEGVGVKTRLQRIGDGYSWIYQDKRLRDQVKFWNVAGKYLSGTTHYLVSGTGDNNVAEFGDDTGGPAKVPSGQGLYQMRFVSANDTYQILGTMYTAKLNDDLTYSCTAPGTVAPPAPVIERLTPMKDEKGWYGVEIVLEPDVSQSIDRYSVQTTVGINSNIWLPDKYPQAYELEILEHTAENTKISITGSGFQKGSEYPVAVKAWNGNLESPISNKMSFVAGEATSTATVERVIHFAEPNGRVQSNIKLDNCGKGGGGKPRGPENCVVGYGYNDKDEGNNWDNTFELWFKEGDPGPDIAVSVGGIEVETRDSDGNSKCSKDNEQGIVKKCFRLTKAHEELKDAGEQPIRVGETTIAEWDFFGAFSVGWDDPPDGNWDGYHIFLVQEGLSRDGLLDLDDGAFTDFCSAEGWALLPHENDLTPDACFQQGVEVRAKFDWDNSADTRDQSKDLHWLEAVIQFGSNKLAHGDNAFRNMNARGGAAFETLDVSDLGSMGGMFRDADFFDANLEGWNVSSLGVGAPADFDQGTTAWTTGPDNDTERDGTGEGRPIWNTGQVVVSASEVRAERTSDRGLSVPALNAFSIETVEQMGVASSAEQNFNLGYEVGGVGGDSREVLEDDASTPLSVGVGEKPRNGRVEVAKSDFPVEVTVTASDADLIAEGTFEVFAPCKVDGDVFVGVTWDGKPLADGVNVEVELVANYGVVPPGTVTLIGSEGVESTTINVPETLEPTWKWGPDTVKVNLPNTAATMTTEEIVMLVQGTMKGTFTWDADQGDDGPGGCSGGSSDSVDVPFEMLISQDLICSVYPALEQLQRDLATPGTADVTVSARSGGMQVRAGDVDGDGTPNESDSDIDGDGTPNVTDPDIDGDGTPNATDLDIDGDGIANAGDDFPKGPPPVARPMPIGLTEAEQEALLEQLYGEQVPVTYPVPGDDYAEGAGQIVVGPDPEIVVDLSVDRVREAGEGLDCGDGIIIPGQEVGWPVNPDDVGQGLPDVGEIDPDGGTDSGSGSGSESGSGGSSGDSGSGAAGGLRVALATPAEAFKGVPAELEATVTPATTEGVVEFAVREIDLNGEETVRILGSAPVEQEQVTVDGQTVTVARASLDLVPQDYGDAIVYARVTENGSGAQDVAARAAVVNPAPFVDNFSLTVGGDAWLPVETGNVLGYGYSPVEFTTITGDAPRITTPVDGPCQVLSTRSIPPQIRMLGTAIAPKRCSFTVTTPGGGAYAPVSYTYDVALSMGTQTVTLAADKAKKTIKKGSMVTVAKKTQTKTDEDYKLKGKKINWSVTSGKDVCAVKMSSSGKVSVKGKKKGTCTVRAKAPKVKRKYKSFTEFYNFGVK